MTGAYFIAMVAVVLAEMGDKTQLLAMAFACRYRWQTVLWAVLAATLVNHLMAVVVGNMITQVIPMVWIKLAAAASFILFALWTIRGDKLDKDKKEKGRSPFWTVAIAFFIAEMGDKTQLMTISLAADQAIKIGGTGLVARIYQIVPVWMGTTTGMIIADAVGIIAGRVLHKRLPDRFIKWLAASCFAIFGFIGLHETLDELLKMGDQLHHILLIAGVVLMPFLMYFISKSKKLSRL
ncbi:MAG TPA: TMEM165/GDT1 family protein [Bacteroidales bacterium]|nr:TMEM165/GDT1 family protein [Bacteroidales bacterium]